MRYRAASIVTLLLLTACSAKAPDQSLEVAVDGLYSASISHNAKNVLVGSISHGGSWWQINPPERLFDWNHETERYTNITTSAISPDGKFAITADTQTIALWDTSTGSDITFFRAPAEIHAISLSNETEVGVLAALALENHSAVIFNASRGRIVAEFTHDNRVRSISLSADGKWLLSGSEDKTAIFWSVEDKKPVSQFVHNEDVRYVTLSNDHSLAFSVSQYDASVVWNTKDGSAVAKVPVIGDAVRRGRTFASAAFNDSNTLLATGSSDRTVQLWKIDDMAQLGSWEMPQRSAWTPTGAAVLDVEFNSDDEIIAAASNGFIHTLTTH